MKAQQTHNQNANHQTPKNPGSTAFITLNISNICQLDFSEICQLTILSKKLKLVLPFS